MIPPPARQVSAGVCQDSSIWLVYVVSDKLYLHEDHQSCFKTWLHTQGGGLRPCVKQLTYGSEIHIHVLVQVSRQQALVKPCQRFIVMLLCACLSVHKISQMYLTDEVHFWLEPSL